MKHLYTFLVLFSCISVTYSQVGINTISPNASAILDISSSEKGVLFPRMDLGDLNNADPVSNPAKGLTVWNTNSSAEGLYFWDGAKWSNYVEVSATSNNSLQTEGDIKHGFQANDHQGWYLLDGRAISELPTNARTAAQNLGFAANLPNAINRVLKAKTTSETLGAQVGSNSIKLVAANIPELTGTTNMSGNHNHNYTRAAFSNTRFTQNNQLQNINNISGNTDGETTSTDGNHNHSVIVNADSPSTAVNNTPASIVTNVFVYLGQ